MGVYNGDDANNEINGSNQFDVMNGADGHDTLRGGGGPDYIDGWSGHDDIFGDAGNDTLLGYLGNDLILGAEDDDFIDGGVGGDLIYGGSGADTFDYNYVTDSNTAYGLDWVFDFQKADTIDLKDIDANSTVSGNQAFDWALQVGTPGAIDWAASSTTGGYMLTMDVDGGGADMHINLYVVDGWGSFLL